MHVCMVYALFNMYVCMWWVHGKVFLWVLKCEIFSFSDDVRLPVIVEEFPGYCKMMHANSDHLFSEEYEVHTLTHSHITHTHSHSHTSHTHTHTSHIHHTCIHTHHSHTSHTHTLIHAHSHTYAQPEINFKLILTLLSPDFDDKVS